MRKRLTVFILFLCMMIIFTACSTTISDASYYEKCYHENLFRETDGTFPEKIPENASNVKFIYENTETLLFSECQACLEYTLSEEDYIKQVDKISKIKGTGTESDIRYNKNDYNYEAYVASDWRKNKNEIFYSNNEYILLDKENFRIIHVYLNDKDMRNVKFSKEYLPKKIDEEQEIFSINMVKGDS